MKDDDVYVVEKIVDSRTRAGVKQYLVKWEGYADAENTWENEENIFSKQMIKRYECESVKKPRKPRMPRVKAPPATVEPAVSREVTNDWDSIVEKVVSVSKDSKNNGLMVQVQFKSGEMGLLPISQVHTRCPLHLIRYYEDNLVFAEDSP